MSQSSIEWTDVTWNPVRGCTRISPGCERCYAERQAHRFSGQHQPYEGLTVLGKQGPRWSGRAGLVPATLGAPLRWSKPRRVFVNSMSDLFHEDISDTEIAAIFGVMAMSPQHTFQVLTKRPERMWRLLSQWTADICWRAIYRLDEALGRIVIPSVQPGRCGRLLGDKLPLPNVWLGVSVEDQQRADSRIPHLLDTPATVRFISAEPLLAPIDLRCVRQDEVYSIDALTGDVREGTGANGTGFRFDRGCVDKLDWVIVGGESGPGARECEVAWIRSLVRQCQSAAVPCFVKQLGARHVDAALGGTGHQTRPVPEHGRIVRLRDRKGGALDEWPADLRVREFPRTTECASN